MDFESDFKHPSRKILGINSSILKGKRIVLGITGSVAAFLSPTIARELIRLGATVIPVMTKSSLKFVGKDLLWWATGVEPIIEVSGKTEHVAMAGIMNKPVDLMIIAPSTTNTVAKLAAGIADTSVTLIASTLNGSEIPIIVLCVAHEALILSKPIQKSINDLKKMGYHFINPEISEGKAKVPDIDEIIFDVMVAIYPKPLIGRKVIITGGPTREYLDDIRFLSNPASGRTAIELAKEACYLGADTILILGPTTLSVPKKLTTIPVKSTEDMIENVMKYIEKEKDQIVILSAAMSDFSPSDKKVGKIKSGVNLSVKLKPTRKLSNLIKPINNHSFLVLFKAEYNIKKNELIEKAKKKLIECDADLIIANDVSNINGGFGSNTNQVLIIDQDEVVVEFSGSKIDLANKIFQIVINKE